MVLTDGQIYGCRDQEACKHNLVLVGKWAESQQATPSFVGMLLQGT